MNNVRFLILVTCCMTLYACAIKNLWKRGNPPVPIPSVLIPVGEFRMGSDNDADDEKPVHTVYLNAFHIDVYPVTNANYKEFIDANPQWRKANIEKKYHDGNYLAHWNDDDYPREKADHPVTYVSWYAAMAYAKWAGKRLPTEAEWEKAARGGLVDQRFPWGNLEDTEKAGTQLWEQPGRTTPVGKYPSNGYGIYDVSGNVWEWCLDAYQADYYAASAEQNPIAGAKNSQAVIKDFLKVETPRVLRGGAWEGDPRMVRVAVRDKANPTHTLNLAGFRCVHDGSQ